MEDMLAAASFILIGKDCCPIERQASYTRDLIRRVGASAAAGLALVCQGWVRRPHPATADFSYRRKDT